MRTGTAISALLLCAGCATTAPRPAPLAPLGAGSEVLVYLLSLPPEAERLTFTIGAVSLRRREGGEEPLRLAEGSISGASPGQKLLASGRVAPGEYLGLAVTAASAGLQGQGESVRLVVEPARTEPELGFRVRPGEAVVLWARLKVQEAVRADYGFTPSFGLSAAPQTPPQVALYCTASGAVSVAVADRRTRLATGVAPVGSTPRGIVLDRAAARAYVALEDGDELEVLDVAANASVGRIRLLPGDGPQDVGLAADGTLLVVNARARTLSFVDPLAGNEVARVPVGDAPSALLVDRSGRRAYVTNRGAGSVTVVDTAHRAVVGTLATEPEPIGLGLSRDASRLYVAHRGSPYVTVYAIPSLAQTARVYLGLGALTLRVDPRTDLVYIARAGGVVTVHDPLSLQKLEELALPADVSRLAIDDAENTLLALMPARQSVAVLDLTSRRLLAEIPVGAEPYQLAFAGERN